MASSETRDALRGGKRTAAGKSKSKGDDKTPREKLSLKQEAVEWTKSLGVALVLFLVIRTFLLQAFSIPSGSMESTLLVGDYLMANNAIYGPHVPLVDKRLPGFREPRHGDVVVFRPTYNQPVIDVVKRVIGEPGDTVEMRAGALLRNGRTLDEPYVRDVGQPDGEIPLDGRGGSPAEGVDPEQYGFRNHLSLLPPGVNRQTYRPTRETWGPLVVPAGHYWLMGDNRDESLDSRYMGPIPRDVIRGKPMFVYFSYDKQDYDAPFPRLLTTARWGRIGTVIR